MGILLVLFFIFQKYTSRERGDFPEIIFVAKGSTPVHLSSFDPNSLSENDWYNLGFSDQQTATILNYKKVVGGQFISREQFRKCFAVSAEKFSELEPYLLLPEGAKDPRSNFREKYAKKSVNVLTSFNPDRYMLQDWIKLGFSERQAEAILKYKNYLGGSFVSKEKFRECFIINEESYRKLAPYLLLPEKTPSHYKSFSTNLISGKSKGSYSNFNPNHLDIQGWQQLGFSAPQAQVILNYKERNLKGRFKNIEELRKCFIISEKKFSELKPYIILDAEPPARNPEAPQVVIKQETTNFSEIDLNAITFRQLIEFGLDEKSAGSILGFRKKLGGFVTREQILDTYNIDKDLVRQLISVCRLNTSEIEKYTLKDAPEEWLKNHPYFKYSADKIIFYRITYPDDKKIWKFLKLKPEYEERMKLYIK